MPFTYATATSGPSAGEIGWFNFENLVLAPGGSANSLTGTLKDGSIVTFDISLVLVSGQGRNFVATATPTFDSAFFGTAGYTDIPGNIALNRAEAADPAVSTFTISNIVVTDAVGNPIPNYTLVWGEAGRTNLDEQLVLTSNGGGWKQLADLGNAADLTLAGLGTQTVTITGVANAFVLTTQAPTTLTFTVTNGVVSDEAFVLGFVNTGVTVQNNIAGRIDSSDAATLNIEGTPSATATPADSALQTGNLPISITPQLDYDVTYTIPNTASQTFMVDPANLNGVTETAADIQANTARLNLVKSTDKTVSYLGDIITYRVAVTNTGNVPANRVVVTDAVPSGTAIVPSSLTVSVPYSGAPASGITLTNPVAAGQTVSISFQVQVNSMPNPNPIINTATVNYNYSVNPDDPTPVTVVTSSNTATTTVFRYNYGQQISDMIESVALEEAALAAIANAEGAKIQKMAAMSGVTTQQLLCLNKSVSDMMSSITMLEAVLKQKLSVVNCQLNGTCM